MPSLYKRGDRFYVAFYDATRRPKRKHVSLRVTGYRAAQLKSERLATQYEEGSFDPWSPLPEKDQTTLGEAVQQFLKTRRNLSGQSIQKYKSVLGQLVKFIGADKGLGACSPTAIQDFIDSGNRKPITKKTYSTTLSPFFNWSIGRGYVKHNPVTALRLPKVQESLPNVLTDTDLGNLVNTIDEIVELLRNHDAEIEITKVAEAEEYRQTLALEKKAIGSGDSELAEEPADALRDLLGIEK